MVRPLPARSDAIAARRPTRQLRRSIHVHCGRAADDVTLGIFKTMLERRKFNARGRGLSLREMSQLHSVHLERCHLESVALCRQTIGTCAPNAA
jgi:hypothetical protein